MKILLTILGLFAGIILYTVYHDVKDNCADSRLAQQFVPDEHELKCDIDDDCVLIRDTCDGCGYGLFVGKKSKKYALRVAHACEEIRREAGCSVALCDFKDTPVTGKCERAKCVTVIDKEKRLKAK